MNLLSIFKNISVSLLTAIVLWACSDSELHVQSQPAPTPPVIEQPSPIPAFDNDGSLDADIRWTTYGVPHVVADNLESLSFGVGFAFAKDNACVMADQIIKYNSERAKYFGPDRILGSGDAAHLINDFGFLTIGIREIAEENFDSLTDNTQAMFQGYAKGYNKYINEQANSVDPACAGQPWVKDIDGVDLFTYSLGVALLPGAENFLSAMFVAAPPGVDSLPKAKETVDVAAVKILPSVDFPEKNPLNMGSNGWALGSEMTENGMGMVLGNPHFPYTGNLRFWQFHSTIPGYLDVIGSSIMGFPGVVNVGFNKDLAWTHTFSTAEHFVVYQLGIDNEDETAKTHFIDGNKEAILEKQLEIEVAVAPNQTIQLQKTSYYTNYGPMIVIPGRFDWTSSQAYAIKDANLPNFDIVDHWLAMNIATSMDEFKQAFVDYDGVVFNNTMVASKAGDVFYIDDSTVPGLGDVAINELSTNPMLAAARQSAGFTILPGTSAQFDFNGPVTFENAPKYEGNDYVQNSNDSYWLSNLENPITHVSPLFGKTDNQQSLRSRMAHSLLQNARGSDNRFSPHDVEVALLNNESYLANAILPELLSICQANRDSVLNVNGTPTELAGACDALSAWDGTMNADSTGAHVFREFAFEFAREPQWEEPFDPTDPVNTPNGLIDNATTLNQLASAVAKIKAADFPMNAKLGDVQFVEKSLANGLPSGNRLPWGGAHDIEGGFNVFNTVTRNDGTELARHVYPTIDATTTLTEEGYHVTYGSSWMMIVNFTEQGPVARGLTTYSQSNSVSSEHFNDQTRLYSAQPQLRPILFKEEDIMANIVDQVSLSSRE